MINAISPLFGTERLRDWRHREMNAERLIILFLLPFFVNERQQQASALFMTQKQIHLFTRLKRLGFAKGNQMKLYGQVYEVVGEPILMDNEVVLLDATETKSGQPPS